MESQMQRKACATVTGDRDDQPRGCGTSSMHLLQQTRSLPLSPPTHCRMLVHGLLSLHLRRTTVITGRRYNELPASLLLRCAWSPVHSAVTLQCGLGSAIAKARHSE